VGFAIVRDAEGELSGYRVMALGSGTGVAVKASEWQLGSVSGEQTVIGLGSETGGTVEAPDAGVVEER
jgi:hypothetical protein